MTEVRPSSVLDRVERAARDVYDPTRRVAPLEVLTVAVATALAGGHDPDQLAGVIRQAKKAARS